MLYIQVINLKSSPNYLNYMMSKSLHSDLIPFPPASDYTPKKKTKSSN